MCKNFEEVAEATSHWEFGLIWGNGWTFDTISLEGNPEDVPVVFGGVADLPAVGLADGLDNRKAEAGGFRGGVSLGEAIKYFSRG